LIELSVIAPVHNEEENLRELIGRTSSTLQDYFSGNGWEFILVDDKSTDRSSAIMKELSLSNKNIIIYTHNKNKGQTGGFETGFKYSQGRTVITMDADLQVYPEDIPALYDKIKNGYELVNAIRAKRQDSSGIVFASKIYNLFMKFFFQCPVSDAASNFTAIDSTFLKDLKLQGNDHRYIIPILQSRGLKKITEVKVRHCERKRGKSKYSLFKTVTGFPELVFAWIRIKRGRYRE